MSKPHKQLRKVVAYHRQVSLLNRKDHQPGEDRYFAFDGMVYAYDIVLAILADQQNPKKEKRPRA